MNTTLPKNHAEPGSSRFKKLLHEAHLMIAEDLDKKVKTGLHEPGHGSAHMEMTLYFFNRIAEGFVIPSGQKDVGSLAAILHDIWRENIYYSHTSRSANLAEIMLYNQKLFNETYSLSDEVKKNIVSMVSQHSIQSMRKKSSDFPEDWRHTLLALQIGDIIAQGGAFGYLRSFSYSGHVLKGMLGRIKTVVKYPKKYQDPLPEHLKDFFNISNNYFHAWILSIMMRTNRNYIESTFDERMLKLSKMLIGKGVPSEVLTDIIQVDVGNVKEDNGNADFSIHNDSHDVVSEIISLADESRNCNICFNNFIEELDSFARYGMDEGINIEDIENDIMCLMEYSLPGICSRVFWGQFNPRDNDDYSDPIEEFMTLPERIFSYEKMIQEIDEDGAQTGIITDEGKRIYQLVTGDAKKIVRAAIRQYETQRWQPSMWEHV